MRAAGPSPVFPGRHQPRTRDSEGRAQSLEPGLPVHAFSVLQSIDPIQPRGPPRGLGRGSSASWRPSIASSLPASQTTAEPASLRNCSASWRPSIASSLPASQTTAEPASPELLGSAALHRLELAGVPDVRRSQPAEPLGEHRPSIAFEPYPASTAVNAGVPRATKVRCRPAIVLDGVGDEASEERPDRQRHDDRDHERPTQRPSADGRRLDPCAHRAPPSGCSSDPSLSLLRSRRHRGGDAHRLGVTLVTGTWSSRRARTIACRCF